MERTIAAARRGLIGPVCEVCTKPIEGEVHVDHKRPFYAINDPKRLDVGNLRIMHRACHMQHTARQG